MSTTPIMAGTSSTPSLPCSPAHNLRAAGTPPPLLRPVVSYHPAFVAPGFSPASSPPPSNPPRTAQTPFSACRDSSTPENLQYVAFAEYQPRTPTIESQAAGGSVKSGAPEANKVPKYARISLSAASKQDLISVTLHFFTTSPGLGACRMSP